MAVTVPFLLGKAILMAGVVTADSMRCRSPLASTCEGRSATSASSSRRAPISSPSSTPARVQNFAQVRSRADGSQRVDEEGRDMGETASSVSTPVYSSGADAALCSAASSAGKEGPRGGASLSPEAASPPTDAHSVSVDVVQEESSASRRGRGGSPGLAEKSFSRRTRAIRSTLHKATTVSYFDSRSFSASRGGGAEQDSPPWVAQSRDNERSLPGHRTRLVEMDPQVSQLRDLDRRMPTEKDEAAFQERLDKLRGAVTRVALTLETGQTDHVAFGRCSITGSPVVGLGRRSFGEGVAVEGTSTVGMGAVSPLIACTVPPRTLDSSPGGGSGSLLPRHHASRATSSSSRHRSDRSAISSYRFANRRCRALRC